MWVRDKKNFIFNLQQAAYPVVDTELEPHASFQNTVFVDCGAKNKKHKLQESQLIRNIPLPLDQVTDFVEFGCGKATLSYHLSLLAKKKRFHLLDRATFRSRSRVDYRIRDEGGGWTNRITKDIRDFSVDEIRVSSEEQKFCFISKHFCGFCTDMCLRKFVQVFEETHGESRLCLAPCCHALIERKEYFGDLQRIEENLGLNLEDLKQASGWASLKDDEEDYVCEETQLKRSEKRYLGQKAKLIFDVNRCSMLQQKIGISCRVIQYTENSIENRLIIS
jgi:hypothetical protein